jgi:hypothetical protein
VAARNPQPLRNPTARRIVRVCSEGKRGWQEIGDALGMPAGSIQHALGTLLREGLLNSDAQARSPDPPKPQRHALYWADEEQLAAAEAAARAGHDPGKILEGDLLILVRGDDVVSLREAMRPSLTAITTRWAIRVVGPGALWLIAMGPDRDMLLVDQLTGTVKDAGGSVQSLGVEKLLGGAEFQAYLDAAVAPPLPTRK